MSLSPTTDIGVVRQQAHAFLDRLAPDQLAAVRGLLETMLDPTDRELALIPIDDEPETEQERQAVAEALESLDRNGGVSMETVLADFGLSMADFEALGRTPSQPAERKIRPGN